jgi:hypothetical protein
VTSRVCTKRGRTRSLGPSSRGLSRWREIQSPRITRARSASNPGIARQVVPTEASEVVRAELDEVLSGKVTEAVESSTLDPA